jgi:signal transduction histidine kinase
MSEAALRSARTEVLDLIVELLSELDAGADHGAREFYDRLCDALCRLTSMRRAGLLLYDAGRRLVVPVGSHGIPREMLDQIYGTLDETPIAQEALGEDRVVVASDPELGVPRRYADFAGVTTLTCTPVSAGGRWLGIIFADRGGGRFELSEDERHTMWSLGKTAALAASAQLATDRSARARMLEARIDLAREIHERVIQRLAGVALVVGSSDALDGEELARCETELGVVLEDLRSALARPLAPPLPAPGGPTLRSELERLGRLDREPPLDVTWQLDEELPPALDPLARSVLGEALRNVDKHARPTRTTVTASDGDGTFSLEIRNDGVGAQADDLVRGSGLGLRIAAFEALEHGGIVEHGGEGDEWRVRLVVPLA